VGKEAHEEFDLHRRITIIVSCILAFLAPISTPAQGCACGPGPQDFLPDAAALGGGFVIVSESTRDREGLASTFADPIDAAIRLDAWGWAGQATRNYARGPLAVEVSVHMFVTPAGASLALPWFAQQRAEALGLHRESPPHFTETSGGPVFYQLVTGSRAAGSDYTLYGQRGQLIVRVTATAPTEDVSLGENRELTNVANHALGLILH
jgi:hypothetical protein